MKIVIVRWRWTSDDPKKIRIEEFLSVASAKRWIKGFIRRKRQGEDAPILIDTSFDRESNPSRRSIHTAKWDDCVKRVSKKGGAKSAPAVCTAALGVEGQKGHRTHNPTWHQRKGMKRRGPPKFEPGWYIADNTGGFLSYIGPMKTEKEARDLLEVRAKNGATGNVFHVPARSENPLPSVRKVYYVICAHKGAENYYLARSGKLTRSQSSAARFPTAAAAIDKAKAHLKNYAASRKYRFDLKLAY